MSRKTNHHMTADEFRRYGKEMVDWIADYYEWVETQRVLPDIEPGDIRKSLPEKPPIHGESFDVIMQDVDQFIMPGITHWQSPGFFAYFPSNTSFPSILGEMMSAGLGQQGMSWKTSPATTELETLVMDWLVDMMGLPRSFHSSTNGGGVIQDTASSATLCALLAARERVTGGVGNRSGAPNTLVAYTSDQAHSSVQKSARIAGIGDDRLRLIPSNESFAMDANALQAAIQKDRDDGLTPFFVSATVGTTSSMAMDPILSIIDAAEGCWIHVDAAMAGTAAMCEEFRWIHEGLERADSYCFNPHKWMFTNFDCDCFWVKDKTALVGALSILPEYLRTAEHLSGAAIDYRDWQIPLGRRFRALKLWFVLRHYGQEGLAFHIREHVRLTEHLAQRIGDDLDFHLVVPRTLNLVCFTHQRGDEFTEQLMERLNASGSIYLSHTRLAGTYTIRMCVGGRDMQQRHVDAAWDQVVNTARELSEELANASRSASEIRA